MMRSIFSNGGWWNKCKEAKIKAAWQAARGTKVADDEVNHAPTQHDANGMLQHK